MEDKSRAIYSNATAAGFPRGELRKTCPDREIETICNFLGDPELQQVNGVKVSKQQISKRSTMQSGKGVEKNPNITTDDRGCSTHLSKSTAVWPA